MKKKITFLFVLVLVLSLFAGCTKKEEPSGEPEINDQLAEIQKVYQDAYDRFVSKN